MSINVTVHSGSTTANTDLDLSYTFWYNSVIIFNRSTTVSPVELWVRVDGTAATIAGDSCYMIPAATSRTFSNPSRRNEPAMGFSGTASLHLISSSICAYSVEYH